MFRIDLPQQMILIQKKQSGSENNDPWLEDRKGGLQQVLA
jgi:hypothetical protein